MRISITSIRYDEIPGSIPGGSITVHIFFLLNTAITSMLIALRFGILGLAVSVGAMQNYEAQLVLFERDSCTYKLSHLIMFFFPALCDPRIKGLFSMPTMSLGQCQKRRIVRMSCP